MYRPEKISSLTLPILESRAPDSQALTLAAHFLQFLIFILRAGPRMRQG